MSAPVIRKESVSMIYSHGEFRERCCSVKEKLEDEEAFQPSSYFSRALRKFPDVYVSTVSIGNL